MIDMNQRKGEAMNLQWKRILYLIAAVQVGGGITIIGVLSFIPLYLTELGIHDPGQAAVWAGLASGITPFMVALSAPYWSLKANRYRPKPIMLLILACLLVFVYAAAFVTAPWQLVILRALQGAVGGYVPIGLALIVALVPEEKVTWAMGIYQAAMVMGLVFGPLLGGGCADLLGYRAPFFLFGTISLLCFLVILCFMPNVSLGAKQTAKESQWSLLAYFFRISKVRLLVIMQFLCNFGITGIGPILPLYIKHFMHISDDVVATIVGVIIFLAGIASALAAMSVDWFRQRFTLVKVLMTSAIGVGACFVLQYIMPNIWGLGFFRAVTGLFMGMIMPISNSLISQSVDADHKSLVFGSVSSVAMMGNVAGPVISGIIAMYFGYGAVFWSTAAVFFSTAWFLQRVKW